jgi:hypothetical protein
VTASANPGWSFYQWSQNCNSVSSNPDYSFIVTSSSDLAAFFYQPGIQYVITSSAFPLEGGYTTGCGTYYADSLVTVNAIANSGWAFSNWSDNGMNVSNSSIYTFILIDHKNLVANFVLAVSVEQTIEKEMVVFPNPFTDNITISIPEKAVIEIWTINGQIIKTFNTVGDKFTIDLHNLLPGVYMLKATTDNGVTIRKFIKQ